MKKSLLYISLSVFMLSCSPMPMKKKVNVDALYGTWFLQNDNHAELGFEKQKLHLTFSQEDNENKVSGFAGCNNFFGVFNSHQNNLKITQLGLTRMACPELDVEQDYIELLDKVNRFERSGENLYLYQDNLLLLHYKK
ncbi:Heat-inducible protein [Candidatus Ornithobacterium hominis]|uniref:META domain-containing protein n=1 Tax=Candidatus Ornithobacterium hominis TaxID=2497989 RepID=UPI0024BC54C0|nr:META domain-containing protein [Candidatus Ornithobacterium hominis]CAI9429617.1 Heat-inducible protein [Candidatus Ornithobacterium hominis]